MGVFQSIARDILIACCLSLDNASTAIAGMTKKGKRRDRKMSILSY